MKTLLISIKFFLIFTVLTGVLYPLFITGIAQLIFPVKANGSLITKDGKTLGSILIGQNFDSLIYFSSRPSATGYNALPSGGSNLGLTNTKLKDLVISRRKAFESKNLLDSLSVIPSEMLFASGSGLDPHITPEAALLQVERISKARNFNSEQKHELEQLIHNQTEGRQLFCLGEKRVNVLLLNLNADKIK